MKKILFPVLTLIAVVLLLFVIRPKEPDMKQFDSRVQPRIVNLAPLKMLVVELKGDPSLTSPEAFVLLYKSYFKVKSKDRKFKVQTPRARWTGNPKDRQSWVGDFGIPIPEDVTSLPAGMDPRLRIETWAYGDSAEILHKGAYTNEKPSIDRLNAFIREQGWRIIGEHEEEYLTPPSANPGRMLTVIRYRVEKTK